MQPARTMHYVIVGSGPAGVAACEAIRSVDAAGQVMLVSGDPDGYYSRPALAYYLTGEVPENMLFPFQEADFHRLGIQRVQQGVSAIHPAQHTLTLTSGQTLVYDRLLLAVGATAQALNMPGADLAGVVQLDHLEDARRILRLARKARHAVVVGGGITALELVEGLAARHVNTHYLLRGEHYWSNVLDAGESSIVERALKAHGVQLYYNAELTGLHGEKGKLKRITLEDGRSLPCDLLAAAIGVRPRLELAQVAGLACERGILVDDTLRTNQADIFAAGDCAQVFDPLSGRSVLDSLWAPARAQGHVAGLNMAGKTTRYAKQAPCNVTRLAGLTTTIIGAVGQGGGRDNDLVASIARGDSETWREIPEAIAAQSGFEVNHLRLVIGPRTLLGAIVMGDQKLSVPLQQLVAAQVDISPIRTRLVQGDAPLADLLVEFYNQWKAQA